MLDADTQLLCECQAQILKALAHPLRVAIVHYLEGGEQCVCRIVQHLGAEQSNVSRHLAVMLRAGILRSRKEGLMVHYSLQTPCIMRFLSCAADVIRHNHQRTAKLLKAR